MAFGELFVFLLTQQPQLSHYRFWSFLGWSL